MATETTCVFCSRSFTRSDALKRHWTTCKVRIDSGLDVPVPETKTRGRKARACDRCSRLKRACDSKVPCAPCKSEKENCTYRRLQHKLAIRSEKQGHAALSAGVDRTSGLVAYQSTAPDAMFYMDDNCNVTWAPIGEHALATSTIHRPTKIDFALLARFPFLENHTRATGFITSFQCGTTQERISLIEDLASFDRPSRSPIDSVQASQRPPHWIQATWNALTAYDSHEVRDLEVGALMTKTHEIVSEIRKNTLMKPHESSTRLTWSISLEASCYEFFNPIALRKYLALFWSCWYPNWPVIHRPTFDTRHKSPILVAVLALIGACLSPDPRDQVNAKTWFDSVEEIVFGDNVFFQDDTSAAWRNLDQKPLRTKHLEILQAAYGVCLYQTWEGEKRSRRRVLRNRFDHLIYLTRDIGIAEASLQSVVTAIPQAFDWEEYVLRESLIRLNCYICNIDASYALFFRVMPRMNFSELVMELPSPESCFQARSREECFVELKNWRTRCGSNTSQFTIRTAVETLSDPRRMENSNAQQHFPQLSVLGMFTIVHVLYAMVHCMQSIGIQSPDAIMSSPVAIALQQWGRLWPSWSRDAEIVELALKGRQSSTAWQSIGFIKHAPEYWLLTQLFLNQLAKRSVSASTGGLDNIERNDASMDKARALITELSHMAPTLS